MVFGIYGNIPCYFCVFNVVSDFICLCKGSIQFLIDGC